MQIDRTTKPKDILKAINHEYNQSISYQVAHRVLGTINGTSTDEGAGELPDVPNRPCPM